MTKNYIQVELKNCRNINAVAGDSVRITRNALNVFFGKNGVGKSSLIRALRYLLDPNDENLEHLKSYEYRSTSDPDLAPKVASDSNIKDLLVFDEDWIEGFCFEGSNVHQNAYKLYVQTENVRKLEKERSKQFGYLNKALSSSEMDDTKKRLTEISKKIGKVNKGGGFASSAPISKAYKDGVPIEPLPKELRPIVRDMTVVEKANWLSWRQSKPAIHNESVCPYCGIEDKDRQIICKEYDATRKQDGIKQWLNIAAAYSEYRPYIKVAYSALLGEVLRSSTPPTQSQLDVIAAIANMAKETLEAIEEIEFRIKGQSSLDASTLVISLQEKVDFLKRCDLFLQTHHGQKTNAAKAFDETIRAATRIIDTQNEIDTVSKSLINEVATNISGHEDEINNFLEQCGYSYEISIDCDIATSEASVLLLPTGKSAAIDRPKEALSYGEKNALALVLFMHEAISRPKALVILDDPISSFDYDKRYGILFSLFSRSCGIFSNNLANRTVLITTHDPLVVCDLIKIRIPGIGEKALRGQYLTCDSGGTLKSDPLGSESMEPFTQLLFKKIKASKGRPRIFGYVRIRQLSELLRRNPEDKKTKQGWTFSLLSDLIHGRSVSETLEYHGWDEADETKIKMCERYIEELTGWKVDFWKEIEFYSDCMSHLVDLYKDSALSSEDKLLLVRLMIERDGSLANGYESIKRFADESCHIGGSYLFQLDGEKYDQVPFYVVEWCDKVVDLAEQNLKRLS